MAHLYLRTGSGTYLIISTNAIYLIFNAIGVLEDPLTLFWTKFGGECTPCTEQTYDRTETHFGRRRDTPIMSDHIGVSDRAGQVG